MHSQSEENYMKAIYALTSVDKEGVSTSDIAGRLNTKASSVSDMIRKLSEKKLVHYKKYKGVTLTKSGEKLALEIIRRHRLWEVFLLETLHFEWDEVHDIAEQLEHIHSRELIDRLDQFLEYPAYDPHGDPIPNADGQFPKREKSVLLSDLKASQTGVICGVRDSSSSFLQYLAANQLTLGVELRIKERYDFDNSMVLSLGKKGQELSISQLVSQNILVNPIKNNPS